MKAIKDLLKKIEQMTMDEFNAAMAKFIDRYNSSQYIGNFIKDVSNYFKKEDAGWNSFLKYPPHDDGKNNYDFNKFKADNKNWAKYWSNIDFNKFNDDEDKTS